jgi:catechol-2,3-dioxygenase
MITGVNHLTLTVSDLEDAFRFYSEVLGLKPLAKRRDKSAYFLAGGDWLALVLDRNKDLTQSQKSYMHVAFSVSDADFKKMSDRVRESGAEIWQSNSSSGESLYFLDPSGNKLEIHSGNWKTRLRWLIENPSAEVTLFD